ncbi:ATP-grasp domain-containing protein [Rhodococcus rhodochrous]|uniref:ATP-grasp domain-containing protein n=1 Tax=Rhodococcus rhodochrous TaxID=1829 RepID=UPI001E2A4501|nr:ATP-grasp domain-containing protein [Rhodococcus rhodochrous]MCD2099433.1 ATP-grasp domain-containing protein [Rhodococcus rhodochrous]MCD2123880.1 ATP-grasp domain-containing protein [Rhodococcus rhodochrous]MCQ4136408.1 ATP-grasp domain-containing protein [Rhodococcus rhodochrous]MDJ0020674.1 ATP-grasp domain-containing protein [Rhodococcus rhodochrous]
MTDHVMILNRWVDEYAQYEKYVDHTQHTVTYIATKVGVGGIPVFAKDFRQVDSTDSFETVLAAANSLVAEHGMPDYVIALYEDDTIVAAQLRERFGCPGPKVADIVRFRDKLHQARVMEKAGIRAPRFVAVEDHEDIRALAQEVGFPIIVKPTLASSCVGVTVVRSAQEIPRVVLDDQYVYIAQSYIDLPTYNIDGLYSQGEIVRIGTSRNFNTCLEFQSGGFLGSLEIDDSPLRRGIVDYIDSVLKAMCSNDETIVFHIEIFVDHNAMPDQACTFLEMGSRVGGAGIPFVWREIYKFDLMWMQYELSCGRGISAVTTGQPEGRAGWLLMQLPYERPCRIESVTSMIGVTPGPYAEALPEPGQVVPLTNTFFEHVAGRFRLSGENYTELFENMMATVEGFSIEASPYRSEVR